MSGGRFPFIMAFVALIDVLLGLAFFLLKAAIWLVIISLPVVLIVSLF